MSNPTPQAESPPSRKIDWLDRVNPIVLKECRQALKGKQFRNWFLLILGVGVLIAIIATEDSQNVDGTDLFPWYFGCISVLALVVVPRGAFVSISNELDEGTWDLIAISPLSTAEIVRGKLMGTLVQSALFLAGLFPFLVFSYFMRGIDLQIAVLLSFSLLGLSVVASTLCICVAALAPSKRIRNVLGTFLMMFLGYSAITGAVFVGFTLQIGLGPLYLAIADPGRFWVIMGAILLMSASYVHLLYTISVSRLSFASANKSTRPRISLTVQWFIWVGGCFLFFFNEPVSNRHPEAIMAALLPLFGQIFIVGVCTATESEHLSRRVLRQLPRKGVRGLIALFFQPGGFRGFLFFTTMVAATCTAGLVLLNASNSPSLAGPHNDPYGAALLFAAGYVLIFVGLPVMVMLPFGTRLSTLARRIAVIVTLIVACVAPLLLLLLEDGPTSRSDEYTYLVTNPFYNIVMTLGWGFVSYTRVLGVAVTAVVVALLTLISFVIYRRKLPKQTT